MRRVIFLDIDGVLNSGFWNDTHQKEFSDGTLIDRDKIRRLADLVRDTDAEIILHSGWRFWFDDAMRPLRIEAQRLVDLLEAEGIGLSGKTPDHSTEEIKRTKKFSLVKAGEILCWLEEHSEVKQWVVLDDLDLHSEEITIHQVKTDSSVGLTDEDIQKAAEMLS